MVQQAGSRVCCNVADFEQPVEVAILRHIVDTGSQYFFRGQAGDVGPIQKGFAAQYLVPAKNGGGKLGAAGTHDPGDTQDLTRVNLKVNVAEAVAGIVLQFKYRGQAGVID
ncbi:hypothetical protein SDC9_193351 [bioreactor metagenome]|uniref:Uncharacterized protein n=1 Tax=bioreactor metagenome TaxID=1076179 RepID=A0A645I5V2_9ZZZZ